MNPRRLLGVVGAAVSGLLAAACFGPMELDAVVPPACQYPAPLRGRYLGDPFYYVRLRTGVNAEQEISRLATKYEFNGHYSFPASRSFATNLHPVTVARLRCELTVQFIEFDGGVAATQ